MINSVVQLHSDLSYTQRHILLDQFKLARNLYNRSLFIARRHYFNSKDVPNYGRLYTLLKDSPEYTELNSGLAQFVLKDVIRAFRSYTNLYKQARKGRYGYYHHIVLPNYLATDEYIPLVIGQVRLNKDDQLVFPLASGYRHTIGHLYLTVPPQLIGKTIYRATASYDASLDVFRLVYEYKSEIPKYKLDKKHVLAARLGVNNMVTAVTSQGKSFIIDGKRLKGRAHWFNKQFFKYKEIASKQVYLTSDGQLLPLPLPTKRMRQLNRKFTFQVIDEYNKAARYVVEYCIANDIGTVVIGEPNIVEINKAYPEYFNTNIFAIPIGKLKHKIADLSEVYGIECVFVDDSYLAAASYFNNDKLPLFNDDNPAKHKFSGRLINHGTYRTKGGLHVNANINNALNIMRKSKLADMKHLKSPSDIEQPKRITLP